MDIKILKLTNGDEIITTLSAVKDNSVVTAHHPLKIHTYPRVSKQGIEESMALSRWVAFSENSSCEIIKNNIPATNTAPKASWGVYPILAQTVKATNALIPIPGASPIGQVFP